MNRIFRGAKILQYSINKSVLESVRKDLEIIDLHLETIQRRSDFHDDAANRAKLVVDMAISKVDLILKNCKEIKNETNNVN